MVEPIKPTFRAALLKEHPELDRDTLDRLEELTIERFQIDPDEEPKRIEEIDTERDKLLNSTIPHFEEVQMKMLDD